jgi:PIN domain nuclease of toxin-antitoxin system
VSVAVTDSQALLWYAIGPARRLGRRARALFEQGESGRATIYVPTLVLVDIAEAIHRGVIVCQPGFTRWSNRLFSSGGFLAADLTPDVVYEAEALYNVPERGDRLIAATALSLGCPLITSDPAIGRASGVTTVW